MYEFEREFQAVLLNLHKISALKHLVLIGSWVLPVYAYIFKMPLASFTTSDIDFSVIRPHDRAIKSNPSVHNILVEIGYMPHFSLLTRSEKYIPALDNPEKKLSIEFLCEFGRVAHEPYRIKGLAITATPVKFQKILHENVAVLNYRGVPVTVPKPAFWAAHKIAISQLRLGKNAKLKMSKDLDTAKMVVGFLGADPVLKAAYFYRGKFVILFEKGWKAYKKRFSDQVV